MVNEILMKLICKKCKKEVEINKHRMRQKYCNDCATKKSGTRRPTKLPKNL